MIASLTLWILGAAFVLLGALTARYPGEMQEWLRR